MGLGLFNVERAEGGLLLILLLGHARDDHEPRVIGSGEDTCGDEKKQIKSGGVLQGSEHGNDEIW
jgi:hypothetical protein